MFIFDEEKKVKSGVIKMNHLFHGTQLTKKIIHELFFAEKTNLFMLYDDAKIRKSRFSSRDKIKHCHM